MQEVYIPLNTKPHLLTTVSMEGLANPGTSTNRPGIQELSKKPWLEHASDISGSLVYLDAGAAEVAAVSLGAPFLLGLGALNVCDLERASPQDALLAQLGGDTVTSLVVAVTRLLSEVHPLILKAVLGHPTVTRVLVLSSVSEHAHACQSNSDLGVEAYAEYASLLQGDVQDARTSAMLTGPGGQQGGAAAPISVAVKALPMHMCVVEERAFVLPACSAAAMLARAGGVAAGLQGTDAHQHFSHQEQEAQGLSDGMSLLAHALAGVVCQLGYGRLVAGAVGPVSLQIARELVSLPLPSPPSTSNSGGAELGGSRSPHLGVILIDRSLDMVTPCSHPDHVMDVLLASLPRAGAVASGDSAKRTRRSHTVTWRPLDMRVDVPGLSSLHPLPAVTPTLSSSSQGGQASSQDVVGGVELLQSSDRTAAARVDQLTNKKSKDAASQVRKWMKQALSAERLAPSIRTRAGAATAAELEALLHDLTANPGAALHQRNAAVLCQAAALALPGGASSGGSAAWGAATRWELLASLEKQLCSMLVQMGVEQGGPAVAATLIDALHTATQPQATLLPTDILTLLPALYSLTLDACESGDGHTPGPGQPISPFTPSQISQLRSSLVTALTHQVEMASHAQHSAGHEGQLGEKLSGDAARVAAAVVGLEDVLPGWQYSVQLAEQELPRAVDAFVHHLQYIAQVRTRMSEMRRVTVADMFAENTGSLLPFARSLMRRVLQANTPADLHLVTPESLGGLLSKGLSRMGLGLSAGLLGAVTNKQPELQECSTLLVFVVGGVCLSEVREVQQEVELRVAGVGIEHVLVAGTALLSPGDLVRQLITSSC